jgi:uncharacterized phage infection (PIP) family protein YhgE
MTSATKRLTPATKALLVFGSAIFHLAIFALIWMLIPVGEKSISPSQDRIAIPEKLVESVRRDVEKRQLEELKIKLSELQNLQTAISDIRASRMERWEKLSATLEEFAPEAAAMLAVSASEAVTSLRNQLAAEAEAWELYRKAGESPEGGLTANDGSRPAAKLASIYEATRIGLAGLREQQRMLREKLLLGGDGTKNSAEALAELESRVSSAVASIDQLQEARRAHEQAYNHHRTALQRIEGLQRSRDSAQQAVQKAVTARADAQKAVEEAKKNEQEAEQKLAQSNPEDRRAREDANRALQRAKDQSTRRQRDLKPREEALKKSEAQLAARQETLDTAQATLREASNALPGTFQELDTTRKTFLSELHSLLDEQEKINQRLGVGS